MTPTADVEEIVRDFDRAWSAGTTAPDMAAFAARLPAGDPRRHELLRLLVASDLEFRWKHRPRDGRLLEDYLRDWPELGPADDLPADLIKAEWASRGAAKQVLDADAYLRRFPRQWPTLSRRLTGDITPDLDGLTQPLFTPAVERKVFGAEPLPEIPGYAVENEIARGGMGVVYKARQSNLRRDVAIKAISGRSGFSQAANTRFRVEAEAAARLQHPNIVQIHDFVEDRGRSFIVMEYVGGGSLADRLKAGPLDPREAAALVETVARAVDVAHRHQIVHRDLKPANILFTGQNVPKVSDFGLAKRMDSESAHTPSGAVLGTPAYMAPEQASANPGLIGPATDVYALGAILYEAITGQAPFKARSAVDVLVQVISAEPTPPSKLRPRLDPVLEAICLECLRKDPRQRPASALALAERLQRWRETAPAQAVKSRRFPAWSTAVAVLLGTGLLWLLGVFGWNDASKRTEPPAVVQGKPTPEPRQPDPIEPPAAPPVAEPKKTEPKAVVPMIDPAEKEGPPAEVEPAKQEPANEVEQLRLITGSLVAKEAVGNKKKFTVGDPIRLDFVVTNQSGQDLGVPASPFSKPMHVSFTRQFWIERLGDDSTIERMSPKTARKGRRYASGGSVAVTGPVLRKDQAIPVSYTRDTKPLAPGKYRIYFEVKGVQENKVYQTVPVDVEIVE